jgi:acyl-CoA synthetase (AMP-forming)/AMP-acid ligase II
MSHWNVAGHLTEIAERLPHMAAVIQPAGRDSWGRPRFVQLSFRQLNDISNEFARKLRQIGITRGTRTVLMVPPGLEFFALTFALFKLAAVPVLIDPGMGLRHLGRCLAEAEPEAFVGVPKAHLARRIFRWCRQTVRVTVSVGRPGWGCSLTLAAIPRTIRLREKPSTQILRDDVAPDEIAAILFTSGSTGVAKGVVYNHGTFASQLESVRRTFQIEPGERDLATFPLFALFGPALGMTSIVPEMDPTRPALVDPDRIFEAIAQWGVTNLFGSPALLNRVGRASFEGKFDSIRRVVSAGAPVTARILERFVRFLPKGAQVFTPYGATEALPVAVIGSDEILGETRRLTEKGKGVCVGRPVEGIEARIVPIRDDAIETWSEDLSLPPGTIGEIVVRGPWVTPSYYNRPEATRLAKIRVADGTYFHRMGDVGYFDTEGRLWFCGRKSQRVETISGTLFTIPCESIFNTHPAIARCALVGVEGRPVLCVEREPGTTMTDAALRLDLLRLGSQYPHTAAIQTILFHPNLPVDIRHNSKIFRERLALWAARRLR